jgi:hypothetical protein
VYQRFTKRGAKTAQASRSGASGRPWLKKALVAVYYWSGTPFGLGDKLEALVEKRAVPSD